MIRARVELVLLLAGAVGCGIAQRTVEEANPEALGGGDASSAGGPATAGTRPSPMGGGGGTVDTGGMLGLAGAPDAGPCVDAANAAPIRALSRWEYRRTVEALTGVAASTEGGDNAADDASVGWFNVAMSWSAANAAYVLGEAERQGAAARDGRLLPCDVSKLVDGTCAAAFVDGFVGHAFRRPLSDAERSRYVSLFKLASGKGDMATGVEVVVQAALLSPVFLHKIYLGNGNASVGRTPLTAFEVASRLSYLLMGSPPDAELWDAAARGDLSTTAGVKEAARRLLLTPAFNGAVQHFHSQWLGLEQLPNLVSEELPQELLTSMRTETERFIVDVFERERTLPVLLQSHRGFGDALLAPRYGAQTPAGDSVAVNLDPTRYFGILTRASTLTRFNNPTQRGKFVRERLLCQPVPPPPPDVPKQIEVSANQTRRQAWEQHVTNPACAGCHRLMDEIGFAFENFDEQGLYRTTDNGQPVDDSGTLVQIEAIDPDLAPIDEDFAGLDELALKLGNSSVVGTCLAQTWLSYALQRPLAAGDECAVSQIYQSFRADHLDMAGLLVALATGSQFRSRDAFFVPSPPLLTNVSGSVDTVQARRKLVLDHAIAEAQWLKQAIPKEDLMVVDQYLTALRELEAQLGQAGTGPGPG